MPINTPFEWRLFPYLHKIIKQFGTPFQIYDYQSILTTVEKINAAFENHQGFENFFSLKNCTNQVILQKLRNLDLSFECSNLSELENVRELYNNRQSILFTSNNPSPFELEQVCEYGDILNIDNISILKKPSVRKKIPETVCFVLNRQDLKCNQNLEDSEFGMSLEQLIHSAHQSKKLGAQKFGLTLAPRAPTLQYAGLVTEIEYLLTVCETVKRDCGVEINFILQRGFGIPYSPDQTDFDLESFSQRTQECFDAFQSVHGFCPQLKIESSLLIIGPNACFVNRAINRKDIHNQIYIGLEYSDWCLMNCFQTHQPKYSTVLDYIGRNVCKRTYEVVNICNSSSVFETKSKNKIALPRIIVSHEYPLLSDLLITHDSGILDFEPPQILYINETGSISCISNLNQKETARLEQLHESF